MENPTLGNFPFFSIGCFGHVVNDKITCALVFKCKSVIRMCVYVNVIYLRCEPSYAEDYSFIMHGTKINSGKLHTPFLRQILDRLKVILWFLVRPNIKTGD